MSHVWPLQDAKARLSELVKKTQISGPQHISVRGEPAVVMISEKQYRALVRPAVSLIEFFQNSPLAGASLKFVRDKSPERDADL